jgi:aminopeptidase N
MLGLDSHNVISEMCRMWGTSNADEFYAKMNNMSDDELRAAVNAAWEKVKRRKRLIQTVEETVSAYA